MINGKKLRSPCSGTGPGETPLLRRRTASRRHAGSLRRDVRCERYGSGVLRSVELFAGAGGLALGCELAGFDSQMVVEWDRWACDTMRETRRSATRWSPDGRFARETFAAWTGRTSRDRTSTWSRADHHASRSRWAESMERFWTLATCSLRQPR